MAYQPKTGAKCSCKRGVMRDNCSACEGTGWCIDFARIRAEAKQHPEYSSMTTEEIYHSLKGKA